MILRTSGMFMNGERTEWKKAERFLVAEQLEIFQISKKQITTIVYTSL